MAVHPRQTIRETVVRLLRHETRAQERVYASRETVWRRTTLPAVGVYAMEELSEPRNLAGDLARTLSLAVLIVVSLTESVDDEIDAIAQEVEAVMSADHTLDGVADTSHLTETRVEVVEEQGRSIAAARLVYKVSYQTSAP